MSADHPPCADFVSAPGGAWPWCDSCGWRADLHDPEPAIAAAVRRKVDLLDVEQGS